MGIIEHIKSRVNEYGKKGISEENLKFYNNVEKFTKTGTLQVLYCLLRADLRLGELQHFTQLPNSVLLPVLDNLQDKDLVKKDAEEVEAPRREKVSMYKLTKKGKKVANLVLPDPEMDIETYGGLIIKKTFRDLMGDLVK